MSAPKEMISRAQRHEARVVCHATGLDVDCVVLNVSLTGALLDCQTLPESVYREPTVSLQIQDVTLRCELVRLEKNWVGIRFLEVPSLVARIFHLPQQG